MNMIQGRADLEWSAFSNTNLNEDQFRKYIIEVKKFGDNNIQVYESADVTSTYQILSLKSATIYEAKVKLVTKDFGESEYTAPVTITTVPQKISGKSLTCIYVTISCIWHFYSPPGLIFFPMYHRFDI